MSYRNTRKTYSWVFPAWLLLLVKLQTYTGCSRARNYIALAMNTQFSACYYRVSGWPSGLRRCVQVAVYSCRRGFESHFWHHFFFFLFPNECLFSVVFFFLWQYDYSNFYCFFSSLLKVFFAIFAPKNIKNYTCVSFRPLSQLFSVLGSRRSRNILCDVFQVQNQCRSFS